MGRIILKIQLYSHESVVHQKPSFDKLQADFAKVKLSTKIRMSIHTRTTDFIAILKYKKTEEGGRTTPAFSSYRSQIKFPFSEMQTSGQQTFLSNKVAYPGDEVEAEIAILSVEFFQNQLTEGMEFDFREGQRIIGTGKIKKIINERLKASR